MRTVREILKESDPQEIADILLRLHLNTLFEQAEPEDTVADIRRLVGEWTKRIISNILNAAPQKGGSPFVFFAVPAAVDGSWWFGYGEIEAAMCEQSEILQDEPNPESYSWKDQTDAAIADSLFAETLLTAETRAKSWRISSGTSPGSARPTRSADAFMTVLKTMRTSRMTKKMRTMILTGRRNGSAFGRSRKPAVTKKRRN